MAVERGLQARVGRVLHQAKPEGGRGDAEDRVVGRERTGEVGLLEDAAWGIRASGDGEQVMYPAIWRAVRIFDEPYFAHRTIRLDKGRHRVLRPVQRGDRNLRIDRRARAASGRMG